MSSPQRMRLMAGYMVLAALLAMIVFTIVARRPSGAGITLPDPATPVPLRVHVVGAVLSPGVYAMPPGSITQDAITAAGGPTSVANLQGLNLAALLHDGEQVIVPAMAEAAGTNAPEAGAAPTRVSRGGEGGSGASGGDTLININSASAAELEALPEIGPALAQRIVDYRDAHGAFGSVDELLEVDGIGPATLEAIQELVTV